MHYSVRVLWILAIVDVGLADRNSVMAAEEKASERPVRELKIDPISRNFMSPMLEDCFSPEEAGLSHEVVHFANETSESLRGWLIRADGAKKSVLFCMGNTGNISSMLLYAKLLVEGGFNVFLFDYQGYGGSTGTASALSLRGDTLAAFDYLTNERGIAASDIGVFGVSLGSPLAIAVAAERGAGAVAVEDILLPSFQVEKMKDYIPNDFATRLALGGLKTVVLPKVEPMTNVPRLNCPLFLIHGEKDWLLPPVGTINVARISTVPTRVWIMKGAGHAPETLEIYELEYAAQVQRFFRDALLDRVIDPEVRYTSEQRGKHWAAKVTVLPPPSEAESAWQIAVASAEGEFRFKNQRARGEFCVEVETPFEPVHVSVIAFENTTPESDVSWVPLKSDLSTSLAEFRSFQSGMEKNCRWVQTSVSVNGRNFLISTRVLQDWDWLRQHLRPPNEVHANVRPRYAREIAQFYCRLKPEDQGDATSIVDTMRQYLPEQPEKYYQLDNAGFQVKLEDPYVEKCLVCQARQQFSQGLQDDACKTLELAVRVGLPNSRLKAADMASLKPGCDFDTVLGLKR